VSKAIKAATHQSNAELVAKVLDDPTLRRGDVVVLPDGVKVFKGGRSTPYRLSDFDDVRSSKLLGGKTRQALMGLRLQAPPARFSSEATTAAADQSTETTPSDKALTVVVTGSVPRRVGP